MIEVLKLITLACQVHPSYDGLKGSADRVGAYQLKCRQNIIKCIDDDSKGDLTALKNFLTEDIK